MCLHILFFTLFHCSQELPIWIIYKVLLDDFMFQRIFFFANEELDRIFNKLQGQVYFKLTKFCSGISDAQPRNYVNVRIQNEFCHFDSWSTFAYKLFVRIISIFSKYGPRSHWKDIWSEAVFVHKLSVVGTFSLSKVYASDNRDLCRDHHWYRFCIY